MTFPILDLSSPSPTKTASITVDYDGLGRPIAYVRDGIPHTISYPDSTHIVDVGGGYTTTTTLNQAGLIVSSVTTATT